ncbi:MAG: AAA family ATPase [Opitutaceae bacterium]
MKLETGVDNRRERTHVGPVIASIAFRNFKALRNTRVALTPFNLVIGPNGSGKTSLMEAMQRLRTLSKLPLSEASAVQREGGPEIEFRFERPYEGLVAKLGCVSDVLCDSLRIEPRTAPNWPELRATIGTIRNYVLDHRTMAEPARRSEGAELHGSGGNLAAVLFQLRAEAPDAFAALTAELLRILPEFQAIELDQSGDEHVTLSLRLAENGSVPADGLSQGILYLLGVLTLAFDPTPPFALCIEEPDRGMHPRMLREIRDALYRLSYPESFGSKRRAVQVVATTHSPYFIDLFRDHPEEVVISQKKGRAAEFGRLSDRGDLRELLSEGSLGDMWFSGILGGVPEER